MINSTFLYSGIRVDIMVAALFPHSSRHFLIDKEIMKSNERIILVGIS